MWKLASCLCWSYTENVDVYHEQENAHATNEEAFTVINARISVSDITLGNSHNHLQVALWGKNLGDEEYRLYGIPAGSGAAVNYYGDPRTYGLDISLSF